MSRSRKPVLAITMGDPGGIGPEVIARSLASLPSKRPCDYLLIGDPRVFEFLKKELGLGLPLHPVSDADFRTFRKDKINFLDITARAGAGPKALFQIGRVSKSNAALAGSALECAARAAKQDWIDALVTAPVNKTAMRLIEPGFQGHTEFLARAAGVKKFAMMFVSKKLKVTLVTIHVPLHKVSGLIRTEAVFDKIFLTDRFLKTYFNISRPRIAVAALNPHGRETGQEEEKFIVPAVKKARQKKMEVTGPLSADQLFFDAYHGRYDAVISMYHDQGLAPFKMIAFRDGVNVTLGLPYLRTSPDHGTAFDIAYQGKADPASMTAAIRLAEKLVLSS